MVPFSRMYKSPLWRSSTFLGWPDVAFLLTVGSFPLAVELLCFTVVV